MAENSSAITNASVTAKVMLPDDSFESLSLFDDGTHGDPVANDGQYINSFTNTSQSGPYRMLVTTDRTGAGAFSREDALIFSVSSSLSEFNGSFGDRGSDTDGDGLFNELILEVGVDVTEDGEYRVTGVLVDNTGNPIEQASVEATLAAGDHTFFLSFDGFRIFQNRVDGPFTLEQLSLVELTEDNSIIVDFLSAAHTTAAFNFRDFQRSAIFLTGSSTDFGTDTDANGLFDLLTVQVEVDLLEADFYQWSANLVDVNGTVIDFAGNAASLIAGIGIIDLTFDGVKIGENGLDGPYIVRDLLMFGRKGANIVASEIATTQAYNFTDFEGAVLPSETLENIIVRLQGIINDNPGECADKVEDALAKAQTALDEQNKTPPDNQAALGNIEGSVGDLEAAVKDGVCPDPDELTDIMDQLAEIARTLAVLAIDDAIAQGGDPTTIAEAQQALAEGDDLKAAGAFKDAVNKYKDALAKAESTLSKQAAENVSETKSFALEQNYPNPFNPETEIRFQLPKNSHVVLRIFNTLGQEIRTLADTQFEAGFHSVHWDSKDKNGNPVSSGVYLYHLQAGNFSKTRKMILIR